MNKMHRAQILLEPEQHQELAEIAQETGTSISEIVRTAVREWLAEHSQEVIVRQRLEALKQIEQHCKAILTRRGGKALEIDISGIIGEIREGRDEELLANAYGSAADTRS